AERSPGGEQQRVDPDRARARLGGVAGERWGEGDLGAQAQLERAGLRLRGGGSSGPGRRVALRADEPCGEHQGKEEKARAGAVHSKVVQDLHAPAAARLQGWWFSSSNLWGGCPTSRGSSSFFVVAVFSSG